MSKDSLRSPFESQLIQKSLDMKGDRDDVYDHNSCPMFSHPHSMGKDTIPCVFEEGELGKQFYGPMDKAAANLSSPMGSSKGKK